MKLINQILFWILVVIILTLVFGISYESFLHSFYFVSFLLPVILGTSWFFNYFLVPRYLLKKRYLKFGLYSIYALIISIYLEMVVIFLTFILLANYQYNNMSPVASNIFVLVLTLYCIVFLNAFILLVKIFFDNQKNIKVLNAEKEIHEKGYILVRADRQTLKIIFEDIEYLESMGDYVKIITSSGGKIITHEKISKLGQKLPEGFIRIHRSYIVNRDKIQSFSKEQLTLPGTVLPISRTYKNEVYLTLRNKAYSNSNIS
ncbi:MAG: LytTR family transcriptional regulator [Flavobacteriaceae bacterium]|nr:LytTR family transcriptional regulator [Flavobacteriaceae bacterium]